MESPCEVRQSLAVVALVDLASHEDTFADGEARVAQLLGETGTVTWPLIVDADTGLILDGSHRARVLERDHRTRFALIQKVALTDPSVRVATWGRVIEGVEPAAFAEVRRRVGLEVGGRPGFSCHYEGEIYGLADVEPPRAYEVAWRLEAALAANGRAARLRYVEDAEAAACLTARHTVILQLPALDKMAVRERGRDRRLPPKSTRVIPPYRVFGLSVPLTALAGSRAALEARLEAERAAPLVCVGAALTVDRRYAERLWQFAGYQIPPTLFADSDARARYDTALARAGAAVA